jgi:hypothetical protein
MPDPMLIMKSTGVAAVVAALVFALSGRLRRGDPRALPVCGWVLALGLGSWLGFLVLGLRPGWPLAEDLDRFLALVFPAFLGAELIPAMLRWPPGPRWLVRALVAPAAAPVLLYGSSYLSDVAGPGSREWTTGTAVLILGLLALALAVGWVVLDAASRRGSSGTVALALAVSTAGAAVTLLLSGYSSAGQMGLPMAGALTGLAAAMPVVPENARRAIPAGPGLGSLFSLLVIGRFFAGLTTDHAVLLFVAPLLGAACTFLLPSQAGPKLRFAVCLILVLTIVGGVLASAGARFSAASRSPVRASGSSLEDYSKLEPKPAAPEAPTSSPPSPEMQPDQSDPVSP